jgi:4-hydroxybenzoate polyprenyltransferase
MHLLKFDISNQIQDPEEDKRNKPDRPLPAGRITVQNAEDVRWLLVPVCLLFSAKYGMQALASSICFEALSIWYNDFGGHKVGFSKNILTATGYMCMEVGATIVAGM